ncbi:Xylulokinase [Sphingobium herbicidovorans NBRC 16415]|uniref:Xylulose kinase n=1 Tax=Sphingobium herbicidovorans (strain ATCC 700291 / DSM 11019 / CCUG 56400 / KCTC 2939 / LMG 18315 / NBRC 16415 / MH) TaxID=1219045 RepID=A0A086P6N3_SPHHM|nr:xylulokinase [Sphingobium herbicidovorans]KFG89051.1 Xylulokinase [Sphingobium herbicidovorans NBRC 16415]
MFLGIDIGTSGVKAVIVAHDGKVVAQKTDPLDVARRQPLWSEQAPDDWWNATQEAVLGIDPALRGQVRGIGLAGQMHGATLLGTDDKPLRPAILWNDGRSFAECQELEALVPQSRAITGNLAMPGFTAPKLLWIKQHEPALFPQIRTVLLPKDYVRLCMTGDKASDMADSSGTLWLDVAAREWSDAMLGATGLTRNHMPQLFEGSEVTGLLRREVALAWGMEAIPIVGGGGDNAAGAAGVGVVNDGDALLSLGTSGVICVATDNFRPNPERAVHAFCHCLPGMWHQMSVHLSAASCIDWGVRAIGVQGLAEFFSLAESAGAATGPELFLPYLSGERTPHNDPHIRAALLGLDNETDKGRIAAAVLEGVAFAHADGMAVLREAGTAIKQLSVIGGGARSRYWGQILASVLDVRLAYLEGGEVGPALGAAKLALMAVTGASPAEACVAPPLSRVIEPDRALADRLAPKLARFRAAYAALKSV